MSVGHEYDVAVLVRGDQAEFTGVKVTKCHTAGMQGITTRLIRRYPEAHGTKYHVSIVFPAAFTPDECISSLLDRAKQAITEATSIEFASKIVAKVEPKVAAPVQVEKPTGVEQPKVEVDKQVAKPKKQAESKAK